MDVEKVMVVPVMVAGVEGRLCLQIVSDPAVDVYWIELKVVFTVVPGAAKPQTVEGVARCKTMWSPKVRDREKGVAATDTEGGVKR